ncbi:hypothetical protein [Limnochorda pilosa]|uniref:Uncharacterized protein n=1 Tax=Limnochorda pilosa TaxID=1555112 RepID=A0A0K2SRA8_LIMPI|nr:hypothetical protein [Limnochorda pilosa]BAS29369.1 hypothetical protein LIP_3558 [Limnochorda pilosa]
MLGLLITIAGLLILTAKEYIAGHTRLARYERISLVLLVLGLCVGVLGSVRQYIENRTLEERVAQLYARSVEELRDLADLAFDLGTLASAYFGIVEEEMLEKEDPRNVRPVILADLRSGIEERHRVFGITFEQDSEERLREAFRGQPRDSDYFEGVDLVYGSGYYHYHVSMEIWAQSPSTSLHYWFDVGWMIGYIEHLMETGVYQLDRDNLNDLGQALMRLGAEIGIPRKSFETWLDELGQLSGRDVQIRTNRLMHDIRQYKETVWDLNPR